MDKIFCAIDFESTPCSKGLLVLGNIPNLKWMNNLAIGYDANIEPWHYSFKIHHNSLIDEGFPIHPVLFNEEGVAERFICLIPNSKHKDFLRFEEVVKYLDAYDLGEVEKSPELIQSAIANNHPIEHYVGEVGCCYEFEVDELVFKKVEYFASKLSPLIAKLAFAYRFARQARFEHGETPTIESIRKEMKLNG